MRSLRTRVGRRLVRARPARAPRRYRAWWRHRPRRRAPRGRSQASRLECHAHAAQPGREVAQLRWVRDELVVATPLAIELIPEERLQTLARSGDHLAHRGFAKDGLQELLVEEPGGRDDTELGSGDARGVREHSDHGGDREGVDSQRDAEREVVFGRPTGLHLRRVASYTLPDTRYEARGLIGL